MKSQSSKKINLKGLNKFLKNFIKVIKNSFKALREVRIGPVTGNIILVVIVALLFIILLGNIFSDKNLNYPVIYNNSDGDLYLLNSKDKNDEKAIKLAVGESVSNVVYANTSERYVLFMKNEDLYLYDTKQKGETTKIIDNVISYTFSDDDKYIIALCEDNSLRVYNFKEEEKLDSDVSDVIALSKDKILYEKEKTLYVRSLNYKKDDRQKVTEEYETQVKLTEDGKSILYINEARELISYNIKKDNDEVLAKNVSSYYCNTEDCEKLFYIESDDTKKIFYYDGKKEIEVAKDIYAVSDYDIENKQIIYSTIEDGLYTLYYQKVGKDAVVIEDELTSIRTVKLFNGKDIYYINGDNEVKYVKVSGAKIGDVKTLANDVSGYLYSYKDGFAFVADVDSNSRGTLYLAKNGKAKEIDSDVNYSLITISKKGNKIYYLKDYKTSGDLFVTSGGKGKKIADDVYTFEYINDDLIYYIKDYSTSKSRGDLYKYNGKNIKLADNITRIASSPVNFEVK